MPWSACLLIKQLHWILIYHFECYHIGLQFIRREHVQLFDILLLRFTFTIVRPQQDLKNTLSKVQTGWCFSYDINESEYMCILLLDTCNLFHPCFMVGCHNNCSAFFSSYDIVKHTYNMILRMSIVSFIGLESNLSLWTHSPFCSMLSVMCCCCHHCWCWQKDNGRNFQRMQWF